MEKVTLIVTTRLGLEGVVKRELARLGCQDLQISNGKIELAATLNDIPRLNLWLRCADRVHLKFAEFQAKTFEELFQGVISLPWEQIIPPDGQIIVTGKSTKSQIQSVRSSQSIIKKAVAERLVTAYNLKSLHEAGPVFPLNFTFLQDIVTMTLDTSGEGLHKRGYRKDAGEAPIKETLAAGLVLLSSWSPGRDSGILLDPLCGAGTILIEAAQIARNIAPGLKREFAAEKWPIFPEKLWPEARQQAVDAIDHLQNLDIRGYDIDEKSIQTAKANARLAGVEDDIRFEQKALDALWIDQQFGTVITNPPYGQRMSNYQAINQLYRTFNQIFKRKNGWAVFVITADKKFPKYFKRSKPNRVRKLYNGNIEVNYYQYYAAKPTKAYG